MESFSIVVRVASLICGLKSGPVPTYIASLRDQDPIFTLKSEQKPELAPI